MIAFLFVTACGGVSYNNMTGGMLMTHGSDAVYGSGNIGAKKGKACATNILGLIAEGDASIVAAAKNGNITNVTTIDSEFESYLFGIFSKKCTLVSGN